MTGSLPEPEPGLVLRYAFLWEDAYRAGREEASKERPAVVVLVIDKAERGTVVLVAPITHRDPGPGRGVELPPKVKAHLGLDGERSWIVVDQLNEFLWPGHDIRPVPETGRFDYGYLPPRLFGQVREAILRLHTAGRLQRMPRT
jgi:mRNA-degrading endonuclease toxin of MazEF toxin-antitoxin module